MDFPVYERIVGALLPDTQFPWWEGTALVDFSIAHTFKLECTPWAGGADSFAAKTTGFTGAATAPNLVVAWATGDIGSLPAGSYKVEITATRTSDSKPRKRQFKLVMIDEVT